MCKGIECGKFVQAHSLEEALARAEMFAEIGADILFIDALESEEEMLKFTSLRGTASGVPKMASLLEGGGMTPMVPLQRLQFMGFKLVAYPLSLLAVSVQAMQGALQARFWAALCMSAGCTNPNNSGMHAPLSKGKMAGML